MSEDGDALESHVVRRRCHTVRLDHSTHPRFKRLRAMLGGKVALTAKPTVANLG